MAMQDLPTHGPEDDLIRVALIEAYAEAAGANRELVAARFEGGLDFDSILGVELACVLEERLQIVVPEEMLSDPRAYDSLAAFSVVVRRCLTAQASDRSEEGDSSYVTS